MKRLAMLFAALLAYAGMVFAGVNINSATKEQLESLNGIGPVKAQAIIDYRKKNGDFKSVDDLEKVEGIGPGTMKQIRAQISVTGKTTTDKPEKASKAKTAESTKSKGDVLKSEKAKEKVAEKSKGDEKAKLATDKKAEVKSASALGQKETQKPTDTKNEKKAEKK